MIDRHSIHRAQETLCGQLANTAPTTGYRDAVTCEPCLRIMRR
jgi:hypothetical protein